MALELGIHTTEYLECLFNYKLASYGRNTIKNAFEKSTVSGLSGSIPVITNAPNKKKNSTPEDLRFKLENVSIKAH